jgi:hypothetical protein
MIFELTELELRLLATPIVEKNTLGFKGIRFVPEPFEACLTLFS